MTNKSLNTNEILEIIENLNDAYGATTPSCNKFKKAIESIDWDETFEADCETYYMYGGLTLTVENIDPFEENWKPSVMFGNLFKELGW